MTAKFWQGKTVLLTGHTGFKGSWLSLWLQNAGVNLLGYSLEAPTNPSLFKVARIEEGMKSFIGDVRNLKQLVEFFSQNEPDIIIHMAAQSLVKESYDNPVETFSTNVMGTVNVLEAARNIKSVKVVIIVTSDKCYENKEWQRGYKETDTLGGYDPYSSSKGCAELVTAAYKNSYSDQSWTVASARAGNVIGGGDWASNRLIPDLVNSFVENCTVKIRNPNAVRPWQHVLEPLHGYLSLAQRLWENPSLYAGSWNFGPVEGGSRSVSWISDYLVDNWGGNTEWEIDTANHPHETNYLKLDCTKAVKQLGWTPALSFEMGLDWVVEWYKSYHDGNDMRRFTENQIMSYCQLCGWS